MIDTSNYIKPIELPSIDPVVWFTGLSGAVKTTLTQHLHQQFVQMNRPSAVLCAFISPFASEHAKVRELIGEGQLLEEFCDCPLEVCEDRDVKGLYQKARQGQVSNFAGLTSPYEPPTSSDLRRTTDVASLQECTQQVLRLLESRQVIGPSQSTFNSSNPPL